MRTVSGKICRENQNTHFIYSNFPRKSYRLRDNLDKYETTKHATGDDIAGRMPFECFMTKTMHTHTHTLRISKHIVFPENGNANAL